jgi:hypothetical protein
MRSRKARGEGSTKGDRFRSVDFGPRMAALLEGLYADRPARRGDPVFVGPRGRD